MRVNRNTGVSHVPHTVLYALSTSVLFMLCIPSKGCELVARSSSLVSVLIIGIDYDSRALSPFVVRINRTIGWSRNMSVVCRVETRTSGVEFFDCF